MTKKLLLCLIALFAAIAATAQTDPAPESVNARVDWDKIGFWAGEGPNKAAIIIHISQTNQTARPTHVLCFGVCWDDDILSATEAVKRIAQADETQVFHFNDDGTLIGWLIPQEGQEHYDDSKGFELFSSEKNDRNFTWVRQSPNTVYLADGGVYVFSDQSDEVPELVMPSILYRPSKDDKRLIVVPEEYTHYADGMGYVRIPFFLNPQNNYELAPFEDLSAAGLEKYSFIAEEGSHFSEEISSNGIRVMKSMVGSGKIKVTFSLRKYTDDSHQSYTLETIESDPVDFTLNPPLRPLKSIKAPSDVIYLVPNKRGTPDQFIFEPEDATHKGLSTVNISDKSIVRMFTVNQYWTSKKEGECKITIASTWDPEIKCEFTVYNGFTQPVTELIVPEEIHLPYKSIMGNAVKVLPENASEPYLTYTVADETIAKFYESTGDLIAYRPGETNVTVSTNDNSNLSASFKLIVDEPEEYSGGYSDGTFILNEEWYSHRNGSINYITPDKDVIYRAFERENDHEGFGATPVGATIHSGKLVVLSKQAKDPGDDYTGGQIVVADARTLKRNGQYDEFKAVENSGGIIRAKGNESSVVGGSVNKTYILGAFVMEIDLNNINELPRCVTGLHFPDMINVGHYIIGWSNSAGGVGIYIKDPATFNTVKKLPIPDEETYGMIQGMTQTVDGDIWFAQKTRLIRFDPVALEVKKIYDLPAKHKIEATWNMWRPTQFTASPTEMALFWGDFYRWDVDTDMSTIRRIFEPMPATGGMRYGTSRVDGRTNELICMTSSAGAGYNCRYNWIHFVDATTGKVNKTIPMQEYYWFQELPIFPDAAAPEINIDEVRVDADGNADIDLAPVLHDPDANQLDFNIWPSVSDVPEGIEISISDDRHLVVKGATEPAEFTLSAVSAGVVTSKTVKLSKTSGISGTETAAVSIDGTVGRVIVRGLAEGSSVKVYSLSGATLAERTAADSTVAIELAPGYYIVVADSRAAKVRVP